MAKSKKSKKKSKKKKKKDKSSTTVTESQDEGLEQPSEEPKATEDGTEGKKDTGPPGDEAGEGQAGEVGSQNSYNSVIEQFMNDGVLTKLNPCKCCESCCGKNALEIGTFVAAALYIVDALVNASNVLIPIDFPPNKLKDKDGRDTQYFALQTFFMILRENKIVVAVVLVCSLYTVVCGILLTLANILRKKTICFIFTILAGINIVLALVQIIIVTVLVNRDPNPYRKSRLQFLGAMWMHTMVRMGLFTYFFLCGFSLYVEIKGRQNIGKIRPEIIEWEDDDGEI